MTAWSADTENAPKDRPQILFRRADWICPAVVQWSEDAGSWIFCEDTIQEIEGGVVDTDGIEWALLPE